MSQNNVQLFLMCLKLGRWEELLKMFYTQSTEISFKREMDDSDSFIRLLNSMQPDAEIRQNNIVDLEVTANRLSFKVFMVIKNFDNQIDMVEHRITSRWQNNKVREHQHQIISH